MPYRDGEILYRSQGDGTLYFANGSNVTGGWYFPCSLGYTAGKLVKALRAKAQNAQIRGRSAIVRMVLTLEPVDPPLTGTEIDAMEGKED